MHIIREEMEADSDLAGGEDEYEAVVERERPVGGLSKAFRCVGGGSGGRQSWLRRMQWQPSA